MQFETESTICAIATASPIVSGGRGALRGTVRISGPETGPLIESLFVDLVQPLRKTRSAKRFVSQLDLPELGSIPVSVFYWPDHRSYTGQPSAEVHLWGSPILLEQVQAKILNAGARLAKPGEFTLRAFLAGRMDLTQCEAVLGLIHANSHREFQVALTQLAGGLATPLKEIRMDLINLLADLEAGLDFVDEDIAFVQQDEIAERLQDARLKVTLLREQIDQRQGQGVGFHVAIVGPPNAGKSSLVNALSRSQVSIISTEPGTTRDYVRSILSVGDSEIELLDTAGIESVLEQGPRAIAQEKTNEVIRHADLVLLCMSVLEPLVIESFAPSARLWGVWTKSDLLDSPPSDWPVPVEQTFTTSVQSHQGIQELGDALARALKDWQERSLDVVPMTGARCQSALANASQSLDIALRATLDSAGEEIIAGELRLALHELGEVAGTVANNDILDALFSRFCIGK